MSISSCFVDDRAGSTCKGRHRRFLAARVTALLTVSGISTADHIWQVLTDGSPAALCRICWRAWLRQHTDLLSPGAVLSARGSPLQGLPGCLTGGAPSSPFAGLTLGAAVGLRPAERVALACSTSDRGVRVKPLTSVLGPQTGFSETGF